MTTNKNEANNIKDITNEDVQINLQGEGITKELQAKIMTNVEDALPDMQVLLLTQKIQQLKDANEFIKQLEERLKHANETIDDQHTRIDKLEDREENVKTREENLKFGEDQLKKNRVALEKENMEFNFEQRLNDLKLELSGAKADIYKTCFEQIVKVPVVRETIQKDVVVKSDVFETRYDNDSDTHKKEKVGEDSHTETLTEEKKTEKD